MKAFQLILFVAVLVGILFVGGCFLEPVPGLEGEGILKIAVEIPLSLLQADIMEEITLANLIFTISKGELVQQQEKAVEGEHIEVVFSSLEPGDWQVQVEAEDTDGFVVFSGQELAVVLPKETAEVDVNLEMTPGDLKVTITVSGALMDYALLTLRNPPEEDLVVNINLEENEGTELLENLKARIWEFGVELFDFSAECIWEGHDVLQVYPGRETVVDLDIDLDLGTLIVKVTWQLPPPAPTNLMGVSEAGSVYLSWDCAGAVNVLGFRVYRSIEEDAPKTILNQELISNSSYIDTDVETGNIYWYWVLTYTENGLTSPLSEPCSVYVEDEEAEEGILFGTVSVVHEFPVPDFSLDGGFSSAIKICRDITTEMEIEDTGELVIGFYPVVSLEERKNIVNALDLKVLDKLETINAMLVEVPQGNFYEIKEDVLSYAGVRYAEPNYIAHALSLPNDTHYGLQWHYPLIRLPQAWTLSTGADWVRVAVLDTGCDAGHPDLGARLDTGNGYNFHENNTNTHDNHGHGTHVAGTIGAVTNNSLGVAGVMWEGKILPVKVLGDDGSGSYWNVTYGILYAAGLLEEPANPAPVQVINMSLGGAQSAYYLEDAISLAHEAGVIIVAAAGNNSGPVSYPAKYQEVLAIGAVDYNYPNEPAITWYSSFGPEIDVVAPGGDTGRDSDGDGYPDGVLSTASGGYYFYQGTSMAAPHVAGVVGLMLANGIPVSEVRDVLQNTAMALGQNDIGTKAAVLPSPEDGEDIYYGHGLVNAYWAVAGTQEIRVLVGNRNGDTIEAVAEEKINLKGGRFSFPELPVGVYRVFAWIDVRGNGVIETGDYFAESQELFITPDDRYKLDLVITEIR